MLAVIKYKEFNVIQVYLNHFQFSNVSTDATVIFKDMIKPFNILY